MDGETDSTEGPSQSSDEFAQLKTVDDNSFNSKIKERRPNCQRCAQHNVVNRLKGHKRICPFKECFCAKCQVVVERQKLMADQIKLRRKQKREKAMVERTQETSTPQNDSDSGSICLKCTQQALGYQQLLSLLDPSAASSAPLLTLSAVLSACPHKD
ncbi:hypothetical protein WR25_22683 [Diploscapter pachys]|uniref:DM domain-containing protein n=1 Tax=Diploscapter pachys TaxID=2018661 RepID=A0A2A2M0L8_9BILA|nr:hypothetical protein WR25_22683 [Diploscapter pachys]